MFQSVKNNCSNDSLIVHENKPCNSATFFFFNLNIREGGWEEGRKEGKVGGGVCVCVNTFLKSAIA